MLYPGPTAHDAGLRLGWTAADRVLKSARKISSSRKRLSFSADGLGEHDLLRIEKRGANTEWVARVWRVLPRCRRSRWALPDLRIATRSPASTSPCSCRGAASIGRALESGAAGAQRGAAFAQAQARRAGRQRLRAGAARGRWATRRRSGAPGRRSPRTACRTISASSASVAVAATSQAARRCSPAGGSPRAALDLLSAARSELFNAGAGGTRRRSATGTTGGEGDVWMLDGSRSVFGPEAVRDDDPRQRCAPAISTRPARLWGRASCAPRGAVAPSRWPHGSATAEPARRAGGCRTEAGAPRAAGARGWPALAVPAMPAGAADRIHAAAGLPTPRACSRWATSPSRRGRSRRRCGRRRRHLRGGTLRTRLVSRFPFLEEVSMRHHPHCRFRWPRQPSDGRLRQHS